MLKFLARFLTWIFEPDRVPVVFPEGTKLLALDGFRPVGFQWGVQILNDHSTPMEFVVELLEREFGLDRKSAIQTMLSIHFQGGALMPTTTPTLACEITERIEQTCSGKPFTLRALAIADADVRQ